MTSELRGSSRNWLVRNGNFIGPGGSRQCHYWVKDLDTRTVDAAGLLLISHLPLKISLRAPTSTNPTFKTSL